MNGYPPAGRGVGSEGFSDLGLAGRPHTPRDAVTINDRPQAQRAELRERRGIDRPTPYILAGSVFRTRSENCVIVTRSIMMSVMCGIDAIAASVRLTLERSAPRWGFDAEFFVRRPRAAPWAAVTQPFGPADVPPGGTDPFPVPPCVGKISRTGRTRAGSVAGSGSFFGANSQPLAETSPPKNVPDPLRLQAK